MGDLTFKPAKDRFSQAFVGHELRADHLNGDPATRVFLLGIEDDTQATDACDPRYPVSGDVREWLKMPVGCVHAVRDHLRPLCSEGSHRGGVGLRRGRGGLGLVTGTVVHGAWTDYPNNSRTMS